jgi:hypothetical protein
MDWLLSAAATAPSASATEPAATQASVFAPQADDGSRHAKLVMSDGKTFTGSFTTTPEQPVRIYDTAKKEYRDVPFKLIKSLEAHVLWEREEREWKFKDTGSDIKEYSGKTYPARETEYTMTLLNDQQIIGAVDVPLYFQSDNGQKLFVIHKRDKGDVGQTLKDLTYVAKVEFKDQ